jgi:hypothetical protein
VWCVMLNEEIIQVSDSEQTCYLRLRRKSALVECLSKVIVNVDGAQVTAMKNGSEYIIPVEKGSTIDLDLQSPAFHNLYKVRIDGDALIEYGFSWFGKGDFFKYNNIRLLKNAGCVIVEESMELTQLQKMDTKMSIWFIGILGIIWMALMLAQCIFRIQI